MDSNGSEPESGWRPRPAVNRQRAAGLVMALRGNAREFHVTTFRKTPYRYQNFLTISSVSFGMAAAASSPGNRRVIRRVS